jgi:hypothetical protein
MDRLITIVLIGFVLFLLGYFASEASVDRPKLAKGHAETRSGLDAGAATASTGIDLRDLEAIPVEALAMKLDARVAAKEAIHLVLNERDDLIIGDELTIEGLRIKITRVPSKDPVVTGRYVILSDERGAP